MAILKCKMCGGDLNLVEGASTAECEFCGSIQTIPKVDDEKKLTLFARANRLRAACEFDKAAGIYEAIVADFPEESEAYWGLVLCKYGIEYVDDPGTGKKVPTCHRSSFESIMEDSDLEQALENADSTARRVYRDEAKQIEELRKGIIAVSANEEPYDIFICYKETAENGDRTLDSVLAQDVYDALTDKGYRVFFSRISLEDKLGVEYEPYIFAALNSAKIMLAFGTDYEYFNAVWVKNEWSRYLKLMAKDKTKHLIPCYKGIDAYDMPKEFMKLQAQDLGKVGATQDLLRGIEKILPKQKNTNVIQQAVVAPQVVANNTESLVKRGNMALEDREWEKADKFFEEVLNQDAECAEAYIGKALIRAKCSSLPEMVEQELRQARQKVIGTRMHIREDKGHLTQALDGGNVVPGYLSEDEIREIYRFDLQYDSYVDGWKKKKQEVLNSWKENRDLSRAMRFAAGSVSVALSGAMNQLSAGFDQQIRQAETDQQAACEALEKKYIEFLLKADNRVRDKKWQAEERREMEYLHQERVARGSEDLRELEIAVKKLENMAGYRDSQNLIDICRKKIPVLRAEEEKKRKEEAEARHQQEASLMKWNTELLELQKDREEFGRYRSKMRMVLVLYVAIFISLLAVGAIMSDSQQNEGPYIAVVLVLAFVILAIIKLIEAIKIWSRLWQKYEKFRPKGIGPRMRIHFQPQKFVSDYIDNAIDEKMRAMESLHARIKW